MNKHFTFSRIVPIDFCKIIMLTVLSVLVSAGYSQTIPRPDHIVIVIEENEQDSAVVCPTCSPIAPWLNALAADSNSAVFTDMWAIEHPSQPNYLEYFSGSNQGVTGLFTGDDSITTWPFTTPNLARQLMDAGFSFKTYSPDLPYVGFQGVAYGKYKRKHNPVCNWQGTGLNQVPDSLNQPFTDWPSDFSKLPTISYVVPAEDSDMHDGTGNKPISDGDYWCANHLEAYKQWAMTHNSLLVITWDESNAISIINRIPTIFYGPMVKGGNYTKQETLYSQLRTFEDMYGLGYAGVAADSTPINYCWKAVSGIATVGTAETGLKVYPNPTNSMVAFEASKIVGNADVHISDLAGKVIGTYKLYASEKLQISTANYPSGIYFYRLTLEDGNTETGKLVVSHQ